jgi:hypothetical protein
MGGLGAAAEGLGDLRPCRTVVKGTGDCQFPFGGQLVEPTGQLFDPLQWGRRHA